ncbi:toll-like receptor Tollo [Haliotis rufescens]|uniref:toll-like receptor Tollo n=1 Tax=Haliotis rufescens TaxID=6454 RepID=UPI00201ED8DF|nr:toll-like receptor Tollo [Haliotis rufescens]XP_046380796.2 toll-like receptor Tollo [Haliotis rufescens]XP_046380797.2 toll-like receptor Tollo [Haliotis rufescens]
MPLPPLFLTLQGVMLFAGVGASPTVPSPTPGEYSCPGRPCDCIWLKETGEVFLDCSWSSLPNKEYFATIPKKKTVYLTLTCAVPGRSPLWNYMFSQLTELKQLIIKNCGFTDIPPYVFSGLTSLQELHIEGATLTNIHPRFLDSVVSLRGLHIIDSNLSHMPSICHLNHIHKVNISNNAVSTLDHAGILCGGNELQSLEILDVSHNMITTIPLMLGYSLPNLKRLTASDNFIKKIETDSLNRLSDLIWLDLTNNSLTEVAPDFVKNCTELLVFGLSFNPLHGVPKGLLSGMSNIIQVNMDYVNVNDSVWEEIARLPSLDTLSLAGNRLTRVDPDTLAELPVLSYLNVSHNGIDKLFRNTFKKQQRLFILDVSYNNLTTIPRQAFRNLFSLKSLDISHNKLQSVGREAFPGLLNLKQLDLSYNRLDGLPRGLLSDMQALLKLNLSHNSLSKLPNLEHADSLEYLDLSFNELTVLNATTFKTLTYLRGLSLKANQLHTLPAYVFEDAVNLELLNMANNQLSNLTEDMFRGLSSLYYLNLNKNKLSGTTGAFRELQDLQHLHLRGNQLEEIYRGQFPDSLEILDLSQNRLNYISHSTFRTMLYLKEVKLTENNLTSLPSISVELPRDMKPTAKMYISNNPFQCDCELGWLKDLNEGLLTSYGASLPMFPDYYNTRCMSVYDRIPRTIPSVPRSHFLCEYAVKCAKKCQCCGFDACYCKYVCPNKCKCVIGDSHFPVHRMHCEAQNLTTIPPHLPTGTTELLLDQNNIRTVQQHIFLGLSNVLVLHLNHSNIHHIESRAFIGLKSLQILYLNDNYLTVIGSDVFTGLTNLTYLHMENNRLSWVESGSLSLVPNLLYLNLQYNDFENISISEISPLMNHSRVALAFNPWSCQQDFICAFRKMLIGHGRSVLDAVHIRCMLEGDPLAPGESATVAFLEYSEQSLCEANSTFFINVSFDSVVKVGDTTQLTLLVAVSAAVAVVAILVLLLIAKKDLLQVWCYSRFGWRLFSKDPTANDTTRYYDAFVSCSDKDEHFIIHELTPKLENGDKKFKLCLHFRDFPVGASIAETIVRSVQSSKRTIVVLSDSFLDDEWCRFSFTTAHQQVLSEMKNRLIVIVMHDIDERRLDPQIKLYMKTRTYLEYKDPWFWEKLTYALPDVQDRYVDMKGAYAVQNVIRHPGDALPGVYNNGRISVISENVVNDLYEVPVSSVVYQSVGSANHTDSSNYNGSYYNSSGHYEEVEPLPYRPRDAQVAPPLPKPRNQQEFYGACYYDRA